jgi:hypothetical protein
MTLIRKLALALSLALLFTPCSKADNAAITVNSTPVFSATGTTANLIDKTGWTGITYTNSAGVGNCCVGGPNPAMNQDTNTIRFSYGFGIAAQAMAINQALSGQGIYVTGYNYGWTIDNEGTTSGSLVARVGITDPNNHLLESYFYNYNDYYNYEKITGTQNFSTSYSLSSVNTLVVNFAGQSDRYWAGYYGPRVRDVSLSLNYGVTDTSSNSSNNTNTSSNPTSAAATQATSAAASAATASAAIFSAAATTDTSNTSNATGSSLSSGGVNISTSGSINPLGNSVPQVVTNGMSAGNNSAPQNSPAPAPAAPQQQQQQAKPGPAAPAPQQQQQQAKAAPGPQQQAKAGPAAGPADNKAGPPGPGPSSGGGNKPQDMVSQTLDAINAQASSSQDAAQSSQSSGAPDSLAGPAKSQAATASASANKSTGPAQSTQQAATQANTSSVQSQSSQQQTQTTTQQQNYTGAKIQVGALNLNPMGTAAGSGVKLQSSSNDFTTQPRLDTQSTGNEQKAETVRKNVEPNSLATGINVGAMAASGPRFDIYNIAMTDAQFYPPREIYKNQKTVDNASMLRQLSGANDRIHQQMVDSQYNKEQVK